MKEPQERMQYRMKCKHRGTFGRCYLKSGIIYDECSPDADCARMKHYDKLHKKQTNERD